MSHILTAIPKNLFLRRQENTEAAGGLSERCRRRCRPLTTVGDVHGGELPPLANCTLTLVTNSCFLVVFFFFWGGGVFCCFCLCGAVYFLFFFCATTKLCQLTAPQRYCPSALNGITSKTILLYWVSGYIGIRFLLCSYWCYSYFVMWIQTSLIEKKINK